MRLPRFRLRSLMISTAFLALIMTIFVQAILFQRAAVREQQIRALIERQVGLLEAQNQRAEAEIKQFRQQVHE